MESLETIVEEVKAKYLKDVVHASSFDFINYFGGTTYSQQGNSKPKASFHISNYYASLKGGDYYLPKAEKFVHYTSLRNAVNILNEGYFRLNSLAYMDDPQELLFAGNQILGNYTVEELKELKEDIYCISFCEYEEQSNRLDNFDAWRLYGDNGFGAAIVFKFNSDLDSWYDNYIGKIHYGKASTEKFRIFKNNHDKFILENQDKIDLQGNLFGKIGKLPEWIAIFLAFHKSSLYKIEDEIRYLKIKDESFDNSFTLNSMFQKTFYSKLLIRSTINEDKLKELHKYVCIEPDIQPSIYNTKWIAAVTKSNPIVEIEKIIVGYRHKKSFEKIKSAIKEGFLKRNGFQISVELSPLAEFF